MATIQGWAKRIHLARRRSVLVVSTGLTFARIGGVPHAVEINLMAAAEYAPHATPMCLTLTLNETEALQVELALRDFRERCAAT